MKRTFTLFFAVLMVLVVSAENPFKKKDFRKKDKRHVSLKATHEDYLPTSIITDYWDGSDWINPITSSLQYYENGLLWISETLYEKMTYTYYDNGMLKDLISESYNGSEWILQNKYSYVYDEQGYESQSLYYNWDGSDWVMSWGYKYETVYDENGNVNEEIAYSYDIVEGWVEDYGYKDESIYTGDLLTEQTYYYRNNSEWVPEMKNVWMYDDQDVINGAYEYGYNGTNFELSGRYIDVSWYIWDSGNNMENSYVSTYTFQEYSGPVYPNEAPDDDGNYMNSEKLVATYPDGDGGGTPPTTIETYQMWDGAWVNDSRWTWMQMPEYESSLDESWSGTEWLKEDYNMDYWTDALTYYINESYINGVLMGASKNSDLFDGFGNQTESIYETHSGDGNWMQLSGEKWEYTYDGATSKVLVRIYQQYDSNQELYVNNMREQFEYSPTNIDLLTQKGIKVFPTAFQNNLAVQSAYPGHLIIYNLGGAKVLERPINSGVNTLRTNDFDSGLYIIKVTSSKGESIQKVIKQ